MRTAHVIIIEFIMADIAHAAVVRQNQTRAADRLREMANRAFERTAGNDGSLALAQQRQFLMLIARRALLRARNKKLRERAQAARERAAVALKFFVRADRLARSIRAKGHKVISIHADHLMLR
jgi:hypothetical protein